MRALSPLGAGVALALAFALLTLPIASATGTGYNQSFTRAAGATTVGAVDLVSLSSVDNGGIALTISFQVSGTLVLDSPNYAYEVYFAGSSSANATAWAIFADNVTAGTYVSSAGGFGAIAFTLGGGGSSLSFPINKSFVGSASTFGVNAYAVQGTSGGGGAYSWLGTNYQGLPGGGTCSGAGCTSVTTGSTLLGWWIYALLGAALLIVVIIVVVVLVIVLPRRRQPPMVPMAGPGGPMVPPPPPPPTPPPPTGIPPPRP